MEERRNPLRLPFGALIGAATLCVALSGVLSGTALACELPPGKRIESERVALSYRTTPSPIVIGQHFTLELAVCAKQAVPAKDRVKLDAHMPEHRHGMNYRPEMKRLGAGRYRSEGWLFHMPGRWEFVFELGAERLTDSVRIE